jgi:sugar/nucleoside kinase (ribokinase family)
VSKSYDVLVAGSYSLDLIFTGLPHLPRLGEDLLASGFAMIPGEAYNSAVAMHRLGLRVGWAGDFGDDDFSRFALEQARREGLDEKLFVRHQRSLRRISVAASFPEDRAFLTYYDPEPRLPAILKALATASARAIYLPGLYYGPLLEAGLRLARARRMKVLMDGNLGEPVNLEDARVRKAISSLDLFLPNAREARCLTGKDDLQAAIHDLAELCPLVVVKDGPNGAYASENGKLEHANALPVTPLDTTGAGDCFNAGFIKAWLDGRPLGECLRWGNVVGGLSTLAPGGAGQMITVADVQHALAADEGVIS